MKKIISTTLAIALMLGVFAQENGATNQGTFSAGARIGIGIGLSEPKQFMNFANEEFYLGRIVGMTHNSEVNFNIALYGNFAFNNFLSLQAELNFMLYQGYDMRMTINTEGLAPSPRGFDPGLPNPAHRSFNADLSYFSLDIPLLAKVNLLGGSQNNASFGFLVGPHVSLFLGRAEFWEENAFGVGGERDTYFDIDNSAVFGLTAGLFCSIPVGPGRVVADFRFVRDFDALKARTTTTNNRFDILQRSAIVFSLGYQISF